MGNDCTQILAKHGQLIQVIEEYGGSEEDRHTILNASWVVNVKKILAKHEQLIQVIEEYGGSEEDRHTILNASWVMTVHKY